MAATHEKEKQLTREIARKVETALPETEVLAVELTKPDGFTVFIDDVRGVDHALCARVTDLLRRLPARVGDLGLVARASSGRSARRSTSATSSAAASRFAPRRSAACAARSSTPASVPVTVRTENESLTSRTTRSCGAT